MTLVVVWVTISLISRTSSITMAVTPADRKNFLKKSAHRRVPVGRTMVSCGYHSANWDS